MATKPRAWNQLTPVEELKFAVEVLNRTVPRHADVAEQLTPTQYLLRSIAGLLLELHDKFPASELADEGWECADSSTGHCVYNAMLDSTHDSCLVCGQPQERK